MSASTSREPPFANSTPPIYMARVSLSPLVEVPLDDFRIASPRRIDEVLNELCIRGETVALHVVGAVYTTTLARVDKDLGRLEFRVQVADSNLLALLTSDETVAVALLDNIKLQFSLRDPSPVRGGGSDFVGFQLPCDIFRFQRRDAYRVRPQWFDSPKATISCQAPWIRPLNSGSSTSALVDAHCLFRRRSHP